MANSRYEICTSCEFFQPENKICLKCGCYMPLKTIIPLMKCPIGKW